MARVYDPARRTREALLRVERQAAARAAAQAVSEGVAETVALGRARGSAFDAPPEKKAGRAQPVRRMSGLDWLHKKGRITLEQRASGERYGRAYRRARLDPSLPSTLSGQTGGGAPAGPALSEVLAHGEGTAQAKARLGAYRRRLLGHGDLIAACDLICGEEKTPREAAGDEREGVRLEAVLKVALDILAQA